MEQNPNQYQNQQYQPQTSIDYLEQIAPKEKSTAFDTKAKTIIAITAVAILIFMMFIIYSATNKNGSSKIINFAVLNLRATNTLKVSKKVYKHINNDQLSNINSEMSLTLGEIIDQSTKEMGKQKPTKQEKDQEDTKDLLKKLEDAYLAGRFDTVYKNEITFKLSQMSTTIKQIVKKQKKKDTKFNKINNNLTELINRLNEINLSKN